jgi:hypothetical protein
MWDGICSSPENGYRMNPDDWILGLTRAEFEDEGRRMAVDVYSSGAEDPRPVIAEPDENPGLWYVAGWDTLVQPVRPPAVRR